MFKPISCVQTNVQPGFRRFPDPHHQPLIKAWRCELTGLSHAFNLYFVACNDTIHVYRPTFPHQNLSEEPDLTLHPPISSPLLGPGIDPTDPHSITRLHVDYLGRDEILLVTCDDGDVVGYRVPEINRVIESRRDASDAEGDLDQEDQVRVFLHRNVGASAWGLAVHQEARLIAISANTYHVTVLAYALSSVSTELNDPSDIESTISSSEEDIGDFSYRRRDHVIVLRAHHNIPSISFDNTGADPSGRWLFASTIAGSNHLWDLYSPGMPARVIDLGHCVSVQRPTSVPDLCRCPNRMSVPHAAWATLFIDPRSCHHSESLQEACGPSSGSEDPKHLAPCFWDITDTQRRYSARRSGPFPGSWGHQITQNVDTTSEGWDLMSLSNSSQQLEDDEDSVGSQDSDEMSVNSEVAPGNVESSNGSDDGQQHGNLGPSPPQPAPQANDSLFIPEGSFADHVIIADLAEDDDIEDDDEGSEEDLSDSADDLIELIQAQTATVLPPAIDPTRLSTKLPYVEVSTFCTFQNQPEAQRPCVIVTKEEIYLFQHPFDSTGDRTAPILTMTNPLFPRTNGNAGGAAPTPAYHRHCFSTQIPELGVFIVASPAGRVGIFSLTKITRGHEPLYAFRMDHLLPSVCRDGEDIVIEEVWGRRLIGVAVGPVQGMLDRPEDDDGEKSGGLGRDLGTRRWRVMMCYHDHTVYSYELGKFHEDESPTLGDLVV